MGSCYCGRMPATAPFVPARVGLGLLALSLIACTPSDSEGGEGNDDVGDTDSTMGEDADTSGDASSTDSEGSTDTETSTDTEGSTDTEDSTEDSTDTEGSTDTEDSTETEGSTDTESSTDDGGCEPGEQLPCYEGPPGTEGVGACTSGVATCDDQGVLGACEGAVYPSFDGCMTPADEDCDGEAPTCTGDPLWGLMLGSVGQDNEGHATFLPDGGVAGLARVEPYFDPAPGVELPSAGVGYAHYAFDGDYESAMGFGGPALERIQASAALPNGDVVVVGTVDGPTDFGDGLGPGEAGYLLRISPDAELVWSQQYVGLWPRALAYDPVADELVMGGYYSGEAVDLGAGPLPATGNGSNFLFARFDTEGVGVWSESGTTDSNIAVDWDVGPDGHFGIAGRFSLGLTLDGQLISNESGSFWAVYTPDGVLAHAGAEGSELFSDQVIALGPGGDIWIAGNKADWVPGAPQEGFPPPFLSDGGYVAHFDADGVFVGYQELLGDDLDVTDIDVGPDGIPVVVGDFQGTIDLGGGPVFSDGQDGFVAKYDLDANLVWATLAVTDTFWAVSLPHVQIGADGRVLVSGPAGGGAGIDFGGGPISGNSSAEDILIAVLAP